MLSVWDMGLLIPRFHSIRIKSFHIQLLLSNPQAFLSEVEELYSQNILSHPSNLELERQTLQHHNEQGRKTHDKIPMTTDYALAFMASRCKYNHP